MPQNCRLNSLTGNEKYLISASTSCRNFCCRSHLDKQTRGKLWINKHGLKVNFIIKEPTKIWIKLNVRAKIKKKEREKFHIPLHRLRIPGNPPDYLECPTQSEVVAVQRALSQLHSTRRARCQCHAADVNSKRLCSNSEMWSDQVKEEENQMVSVVIWW